MQAASAGADRTYDIAIIGSGIAGSTLAAILARHGLDVIVFDAKSHPRFAIGESMILETSESMRALAEFFDVPELAYFSSEAYLPYIGNAHGIKRHFSFLHHRPGREQEIEHSLQAVIPKRPHGHELHLYRQDSDYFLTVVAIAYGATVLQDTPVQAIQIDSHGVSVEAGGGETYCAQFVVDAGGYRSLIAEQFGLRTHDLQTQSRAIFTHMVQVPDYHNVGEPQDAYGIPFSVAEGTLHHLFEGGWLWVIPFDNHKQSVNPLCSVGLMLDPRLYPMRTDVTPEREFYDFIEKFPSIAAQFQRARAVRAWTRTGRIQYASTRVVGDRFALLGHAAGFIDPLFSKGLYVTNMCVSMLAHLLLDAHAASDFGADRLQPLEDLTQAYVDANDRLVAACYKSFQHYDLWMLMSVQWLLGAYTEYLKLLTIRAECEDRHAYHAAVQQLRLVGGGFPAFKELEEKVYVVMERVDPTDEVSVAAAVAEIRGLYAEIDWMPDPFRAVLEGHNHLPRMKIRPDLFRPKRGFLRSDAYRRHFFGDHSMLGVMKAFVREHFKYSEFALRLRKRRQQQQIDVGRPQAV